MARFPSDAPAATGSQRWLQICVNERRELLDRTILEAAGRAIRGPIRWVSPLADDAWAEYRDETFLDRLGITLRERPLGDFWPALGPQWDALGIAKDGARILVEAKGNEAEVAGDCSASGAVSQMRIRRSFKEVQQHLGVEPSHDWMNGYYQYANRIAHLHLIREINRIPAWLVFLYFVNDKEQKRIATRADWDRVRKRIHRALGLSDSVPGVIDAFVDVKALATASAKGKGAR